MAMSTEAELLVLDEPTIGLDPVARVEVWKLIRDYISKGRTILLTTHYMEEADEISDKLAIVNKGKVVATGTPKEVKARLNATHAVVVRSSNAIPELQKFGRVLRTGTNIRVITSQKGAEDLTSFCLRRNLDVSVRQVTLEDVFISEVGEFDSDAA
jgi:ABC-type multidrug transport system ATPase subunit